MNKIEKWQYMPSRHAEIDAYMKIKKYRNLPKKVDFFVIRITKSGKLSESRPCYHCIDILSKSRLNIVNVYYSTSEGKIVCESFKEIINNLHESKISYGFRHK